MPQQRLRPHLTKLKNLLYSCIIFTSGVCANTEASFVLIDLPGPQLYPLFGFLPCPASLYHQILLIATLSLSLITFSYFRYSVLWAIEDAANMIAATGLATFSLPSSFNLAAGAHPHSIAPRSTTLSTKSKLRRQSPKTMQAISSSSSGQTSLSRGHHAGLVNTGNTCFFNSVIQSLASVEPFIEHLLRLRSSAEQWDVPTPVVDALLDLIGALNTPTPRRSALSPSALTAALSLATQASPIRSLMTAHHQQDAHELLILLLETISKERAAILSEVSLVDSEARNSGLASILGRSVQIHTQLLLIARRELINPFEALVAQRTACLRCGYYDVIRNTVSEELSINVPYRRGTTVEDCLDAWAGLEGVEWRCWHCTVTVNLEKFEKEVQRLSAGASDTANGNGTIHLRKSSAGDGSAYEAGMVNCKNAPETMRMTTSAKKRLKEMRKTHSALSDALAKSLTEEEFRALHPTIRLSAPPLPPPSASGSTVTATKQIILSRPPQTLAIHLNRSMYYGMGAGKNNTQVHLDEYLDLGKWCMSQGVEADAIKGMNEFEVRKEPTGTTTVNEWARVGANGKASSGASRKRPVWMSDSCEDGPVHDDAGAGITPEDAVLPQTLYRLDSIVVHYGGHSFGHYVSYRRRPRRKRRDNDISGSGSGPEEDDDDYDGWLRISDDSVTPVSMSEVLGQNAFLVFYQQVRRDRREKDRTSASSWFESPSSESSSQIPTSGTNAVAAPSIAVAKAMSKSRLPRARSLQRWQLTDRLSMEPVDCANYRQDAAKGPTELEEEMVNIGGPGDGERGDA